MSIENDTGNISSVSKHEKVTLVQDFMIAMGLMSVRCDKDGVRLRE